MRITKYNDEDLVVHYYIGNYNFLDLTFNRSTKYWFGIPLWFSSKHYKNVGGNFDSAMAEADRMACVFFTLLTGKTIDSKDIETIDIKEYRAMAEAELELYELLKKE